MYVRRCHAQQQLHLTAVAVNHDTHPRASACPCHPATLGLLPAPAMNAVSHSIRQYMTGFKITPTFYVAGRPCPYVYKHTAGH